MKTELTRIFIAILCITVCLLAYKIYKLEKGSTNLSSQIKELQKSNELQKNNSSKEDSHLALAWQNNKGKWGVMINNNFFPLVQKPIYAFNYEGKQYEIYSGLSFTPGDSSRLISTSSGRMLIYPSDPRFYTGISLNPVLQPVLVKRENRARK
jgi:hypothetical protein